MKQCSKCGLLKAFEEYNRRAKSRLRSRCKPCLNEYQREYYKGNKHKSNIYRGRNTRKYRLRNRQNVAQYLLVHPCVDCGERDPIVLEFDHVRGTKHSDISTMVRCAVSWERIALEIQKCEVRCANCHRRKTFKEGGWGIGA